jgi:uncharacterized protein (TIRG00374 family)
MEDKSKYLKYGLHIAIFSGLLWAIVKFVNGQEVLAALKSFAYIFLPFMIALAVGYLLLRAARFALLMTPFIKNLPKRLIGKGYISGQPATLLPGGVAARAGLMSQIDIPVSESSVPIAFNSIWDQIIFISGGLIVALWFPAARLPIFIILGVLAVIGILLLLPPSRAWFSNLAQRIAKRFNYEEQWQRFLDAIPKMFAPKLIIGAFLFTVVAFAMQIVILGLTMRGLKLDVSVPTLFLAFIVPTLLGRLVPVPGGIGVTEASMVGFLTSAAAINTDTTVAAVAIFRIVTIVMPALVGAVVYYFFWKGEDEIDGGSPHSAKDVDTKGVDTKGVDTKDVDNTKRGRTAVLPFNTTPIWPLISKDGPQARSQQLPV